MKNPIAMLFGAALFVSAGALAQQPAFEELDADGDGAINKEEAAVHEQLSALFDSADTDQSGSLSKDEFIVVVPE